MTMKTTFGLLATGALLLSPTLARAGITIVAQRGTDAPTTMFVEGERARFNMTKQDEHASGMILDGAGKRFLILNDKEKSYSEITQEDMKRIRERVDQMRAMQEERMKSLPPEQKKKMEEMMARMGAAPKSKPLDIKFERTGDKKSVNGFACEVYRMLEDGKVVEEECVSPWSAGVVKKSDFEGLRKIAEEMAENFGGGANHERDFFMMKKLDAYPGFPITRTKIDADGKRSELEQVKSVKRGSIDGATFAVPAGYTKKPSPFDQMGGPGGPGGPGMMGGPGGHRHGGPDPKP